MALKFPLSESWACVRQHSAHQIMPKECLVSVQAFCLQNFQASKMAIFTFQVFVCPNCDSFSQRHSVSNNIMKVDTYLTAVGKFFTKDSWETYRLFYFPFHTHLFVSFVVKHYSGALFNWAQESQHFFHCGWENSV